MVITVANSSCVADLCALTVTDSRINLKFVLAMYSAHYFVRFVRNCSFQFDGFVILLIINPWHTYMTTNMVFLLFTFGEGQESFKSLPSTITTTG